jgi:hypothetical protein
MKTETRIAIRMKNLTLSILLVLSFFANAQAQQPGVARTIEGNDTVVRMSPLKISGEKDEYYSLHAAVSYRYEGREPKEPDTIEFEIQSVVKKRSLNPDLYVVFVVDGERIFFSSNRRAVKKPIPGRRMIGERITMRMPLKTYLKIAGAESSLIKMGKTSFPIGAEQKAAMLKLLQPDS